MATIYGSINNDSLTNGTNGNDTFLTSLGSDYVQATAGNDVFNLGFAKSANYWTHSFNDSDTLDYRNAWTSYAFAAETDIKIVVDLELGTIRKLNAAGTLLNTDTVIGVDAIYGTAGSDVMRGRDFWDYEEFRGTSGNDTMDGRGGNDGVNYGQADGGDGIKVNLAAGTVTNLTVVEDTHTLREIEIVTGTNYTDVYDATGYGGSSVNKNSFGEDYNLYNPLAGDDTVKGNGGTILNYGNSLGGSITVNLSSLTNGTVSANIITAFTDDASTTNGITPGNILASGIAQVRSGAYNDTLIGGGRTNANGSNNNVSGDTSFEGFRGNGGNDFIDGKTGYDRADYGNGNQIQGITVNLAAGTVVGDPFATGTDTIRGVESVRGTYMDDHYDATGFTLSNAASASVNSGDIVAVPVAGAVLTSNAFNEFQPMAGNDTVIGNGATRISFSPILVETLTGPQPNVVATFTSATAGSATYGNNDGGYGTVTFTGTVSIVGSAGNDSITGSVGTQGLRGYYGNDTLLGGSGNDALYGHNGSDATALNLSSTFTDNDSLDGGSGDDLLRGDFGNDILIGGTGVDRMEGGTGNDTYSVDVAGDIVTELASGGTDTVNSSATYTLSANVERLTLTGSAAINGTGNTGANTLTGNSGSNSLSGGNGNDTLSGGSGVDTLNGGSGADRVTGGTGNDIFVLNSKTGADTFTDFTSGADDMRFLQATLKVGDGDALVEGALTRAAPGGFTTSAELVIFTGNAASLSTASAAAAIGSATSAYAAGRTALFAIDNGTSSAVYLFTSSGADAVVSAGELTLLTTLTNTAATVVGDYVFA